MIEALFDTGISKACEKCKRFSGAKTPFIKYRGEGGLGILLVVDQPTEGDDKKGKVLFGETRTALMDVLRLMGYNLEKDFWITAGVKCWGAKKPTHLSCAHCREKLEKEIADLNPKGVFLMGSDAIKTLVGEYIKESSEYTMAGLKIPYHKAQTYVYPLFSPQHLVSKKSDKNFHAFFKRTFKEAMVHVQSSPEVVQFNPYEYVQPLTEYTSVKEFFDMLSNFDGAVAFDYETTGIKPYAPGHKITSVGIALEGGDAYSFPLDYPGAWTDKEHSSVRAMMRGFLQNNQFKVAHNSAFEIKWSNHILGVTPAIAWCSMTMQHLIDTRGGGTGLKDQAFFRWGIEGYDDDAAPYIKAAEGEEFNRMTEMPLDKQLFYVGIDALLTMKLFMEQEEELSYNEKGAKFFNLGVQTLAEITDTGIHCDINWYNEQETILTKQIKEMEEELMESQEVAKHMRIRGLSNWEYTSTKQVTELLVETLGLKSDKETASGKISCTEEVLSKMNHWIPGHIIKLRKLLKLRDTYLAQFLRELVEGKIHPDYTLHIARSLRSSSRNPNFQNLPKRDVSATKIVRGGLKPSKGNRLCEIDFSGIEVSTSVLYHKDPVFLHYLESDTADMHRDNAADIWKTPGSNVSKKARFYAKNCWTFPQFYGDYYGSCAVALWENRFEKLEDGVTCVENLKKNGIKTYKQFVEHLKTCEDILWNKRFKVYSQWKNDIQNFYQKYGYVETYFGFKYSGYMDKKQAANYPIQGTAFHILLWCLIRVNTIAKKEKWKTKIIGQIHDSMILDIDPAEQSHVLATVKHVCEVEVVERFDWITTQFRVEIELSEIDGSFADLQEFHWEEAA